MRISNPDELQLVGVNLALTDDEARQLRDALTELMETRESGWHVHVSSRDYSREVTVYREDDATLQ